MLPVVSLKSIEDILPYIAITTESSRKTTNPNSILEKIVTTSIKPPKRLETESLAKKQSNEVTELTYSQKTKETAKKISYGFFIPTGSLKYESIEIKYTSRERTESLELSLQDGKEKASIKIEKPSAEQAYSIQFIYDMERKGYNVRYESEYKDRLDQARQDFTSRIDKSLEILPKSLMGGVLGFTYLGSAKMTRRDDLFGDMALMVDVHEAIHTPDEYETRRLTDWILKMERPKYKR